jgi:hypothetical protein
MPALAAVEERLRMAAAAVDLRPAPSAIAARTVYTLLYAGAIAGAGRWLRPNQVVRMTDEQARDTTTPARFWWAEASSRPGFSPSGRRWYAENTRESVRLVLAGPLLRAGAVVERLGLSRSSPAPRWALETGFAAFVCAPDNTSAAAALGAWLRERGRAPAADSAPALLARRLLDASRAVEAFVAARTGHPAAARLQRLAVKAAELAVELSGQEGNDVPEVRRDGGEIQQGRARREKKEASTGRGQTATERIAR